MKAFFTLVALLFVGAGCSSPSADRVDAGTNDDLGVADASNRATDMANAPDEGARDGEAIDGAEVDGASTVTDASTAADASAWRSSLYPEDWTPAFADTEGRFLHDFSYAGYRNGQAEFGVGRSTTRFDVVADYSADATGASDATTQIQAAIDAAEVAGGEVYFPSGLYRVDGKLDVRASNVVLVGESAELSRLYFTKTTEMAGKSHLHFRGSRTQGSDIPLAADGASRESHVLVTDAGDLAPGDDIAIGFVITDEFVADHGMTGTWTEFNGTWQTFFRRQIVSIDRSSTPHRIELDVPLRYPALMRDSASVRKETGYLHEVGIESLSLSNAVSLADAWSVDAVDVLRFENVEDAWARDVHSFSSPNAPTTGAGRDAHLWSKGIVVLSSKRITIADSSMEMAENKGPGGNGYLFEMKQVSEVLFRDLIGRRGRHAFIQNWGFGTTGCVWLRVHSSESLNELNLATAGIGLPATSEFHHSLATANLIDSSTFDDGMKIVNRGSESSGAGLTGTENAFWNTSGRGSLVSMQFGWGYVMGTREINLSTSGVSSWYRASAPTDFVEGEDFGGTLTPQSLYEDQLSRR